MLILNSTYPPNASTTEILTSQNAWFVRSQGIVTLNDGNQQRVSFGQTLPLMTRVEPELIYHPQHNPQGFIELIGVKIDYPALVTLLVATNQATDQVNFRIQTKQLLFRILFFVSSIFGLIHFGPLYFLAHVILPPIIKKFVPALLYPVSLMFFGANIVATYFVIGPELTIIVIIILLFLPKP